MTNFEKLFNDEMKNPKFKYHFEKAKFERIVASKLEEIEKKIKIEKPSIDNIIDILNNFRVNIHNEISN